MRKYLRTSPKRKWHIALRILLIVAMVLLVAWAYGFVADHPDVWGQRPPSLDGGIAIVVSLLVPFAALLFLVNCVDLVVRRKRLPHSATNS